MKLFNFKFCFFLLTFSFLVFSSGCGEKAQEVKKEEPIPVKLSKVKLSNIQKILDYIGDIKAQDEALVYPKVNGKIIEKLAEEGEDVVKGEIIAYIDRDEVGFKFENAPVESPLTGIIGRVYVDRGATVTVQTPIAMVVNIENVIVDLDIPEEFLPRINIGQPVEISLQPYPGRKFTGRVSRISPVLDLSTRSAPVEIIIYNQDSLLKPGMFVEARLILEEHENVPVIAREAILGKSYGTYVYVIEGNIARQRNIKIGIHQGADYEVLEGLKEGDLVVIMGQQKLYEAAPVILEAESNINN